MRRARPVLEAVSVLDTESELSYASGPKSVKPTVKVVWRGGKKVIRTCNSFCSWHAVFRYSLNDAAGG